MSELKVFFYNYIRNNLGLINLFGKTFGRFLFLLLTSFLAYKLSIKDFAEFAIFWSSLRMFTFYTANNLYIVYFNKVRKHLIENKTWPKQVSCNIVLTSIFFSITFTAISLLIFDSIIISILIFPCLLLFIIIRNLSEFAKADHSLFLSIFIEDFLFYLFFFIFSLIGVFIFNGIESIVIAVFLTLLTTAIICLILFKRKFGLKINTYKLEFKDFSISDFRLGFNYTVLRGNEVLSNFAVRYLGQIYFGDVFVASAHIMYQFYNVFVLLTMSVISGLQSKITVKKQEDFNKDFIKKMYLKMLKTIAPFIISVIILIGVFNLQILTLFFPKYVEYNSLLVKVSFTGLIFMFIQPLVFLFIYNNKISNLRVLNFSQYFVMIALYLLPLFFNGFNPQYWLLLVMTSFIIVQGFYVFSNYNKIA